MTFAHAGLGIATGLKPGAVYKVLQLGTATPAAVYTDADKDATLTPSVAADSNGNAVFYSDPGAVGLLLVGGSGNHPQVPVGVPVNNADLGGGSSPILREFPFAFDAPGLSDGLPLYTPAVGETITLAFLSVPTTVWDGTTPLGDFGQFNGTDRGLLANGAAGAQDMTALDPSADDGTGMTTPSKLVSNLLVVIADPILVVVSEDGTKGGTDPGSTQGDGVLYLVTATAA